MIPGFTGKISSAFAALGDPITALADLEPERLLALRGREAEIQVVHNSFKGKTYANVVAINGVSVK